MSGSDSSAGDGDASNDEEEGNKTSVFVVVTIILLSIGVIILCCKWYLKHGFRIPKVCQDLQSWCETGMYTDSLVMGRLLPIINCGLITVNVDIFAWG